MEKYVNTWPNRNRCYNYSKLLIAEIGYFNESEKEKIVNFDNDALKKMLISMNVCGGFFGGQKKNSLKFIEYYYDILKLFIKKKLFIGKDQNLFAFVAYAHPEVVELIRVKFFFGLKRFFY